jgi:hypothetical protein
MASSQKSLSDRYPLSNQLLNIMTGTAPYTTDGEPGNLPDRTERRATAGALDYARTKEVGAFGVEKSISPVKQTCRILKKHHLGHRMRRKKPFISAANALKRMKWAADNAETSWKEVMLTDECCVKIGEVSGRQHCWRTDSNAYNPDTMQVTQVHLRIHIWKVIQ